jgi:TatD DNase family protein
MTRQTLIDIGINLAHDGYDRDREQVIERALSAGVERMVVTGSSIDSIHRAIALCHRWPTLMRATAGVHPHHAREFTDTEAAALEELLEDPMVVAAGECGLDYFRNFSPPEDQRRALTRQLELAARHHVPVFLHERDAHADFIAILRDFLPELPCAVVHCFTGTRSELDAYLDQGLFIGITGWVCDERRGQGLQALVRHIPLDRLMIETDGPYLLPRDLDPKPKDRRNEPMYLRHISEVISRIRGESVATVAAATTRNALEFFRLPPLSD